MNLKTKKSVTTIQWKAGLLTQNKRHWIVANITSAVQTT